MYKIICIKHQLSAQWAVGPSKRAWEGNRKGKQKRQEKRQEKEKGVHSENICPSLETREARLAT